LGVAGLALASSLASLAQLAVLAWAVARVPVGEGPEPLRRYDAQAVRRILRLGAPIGLQLGAEVGIFALVQLLIAGMGVTATAGHQIALVFASFSFSFCLGIGAATSVQVGRAIGRGDVVGTRRAGLAGMLAGAGFMAISGVVMALAPGELIAIMNASPDV